MIQREKERTMKGGEEIKGEKGERKDGKVIQGGRVTKDFRDPAVKIRESGSVDKDFSNARRLSF